MFSDSVQRLVIKLPNAVNRTGNGESFVLAVTSPHSGLCIPLSTPPTSKFQLLAVSYCLYQQSIVVTGLVMDLCITTLNCSWVLPLMRRHQGMCYSALMSRPSSAFCPSLTGPSMQRNRISFVRAGTANCYNLVEVSIPCGEELSRCDMAMLVTAL